MVPNACVVEVIERVPDADVAIVAARVGERLGMPPERVRQLIERRTGPITRALRPEKADAIAQTFEAVGVRVIVRAAEPEEIEEARAYSTLVTPPSRPPSTPDAAPSEGVARAEPAAAPDPAGVAAGSATSVAPAADAVDAAGATGAGAATSAAEAASPPPWAAPHDADDSDLVVGAEDDPAARAWQPQPGRGLGSEPPAAQEPETLLEPEDATDAAPSDEPAPVRDATPVPEPTPVQAPPAMREPPPVREPELDERPEPDVAPEPDGPPEPVEAHAPPTQADEADEGPGRGELPAGRPGFPEGAGWDDGDTAAGAWSTRRGGAPAGPAAGTPQVPEFSIGRGSRQRVGPVARANPEPDATAPDTASAAAASPAAADRPVPAAPADRPVPTAWRGLGSDAPGPARPPTAPVPRRAPLQPDLDDATFAAAPRVGRRRGLMLIALAVSVVLFVLAQWWTASRAATYDPYDAYRRGEFDAAGAAWSRAAADGDASAQFMLGYLAEAGLGAPWSARTAAAWYRAAAEGGHAEAMWRLARLYEVGLGVAPDAVEARRWYRAAAELGHAEAAFAWGRLVLREAGVALGAAALPSVNAATAAEAARAFARATELGWHEAATYAAAFAALAEPAP